MLEFLGMQKLLDAVDIIGFRNARKPILHAGDCHRLCLFYNGERFLNFPKRLVQLIIYPSFRHTSTETFVAYHKWYRKRIAGVVLPLMVLELVLAASWIMSDKYSTASVLPGFFTFMAWLSTFALQVPIHMQLKKRKDDLLIRRLIATNWIRTAAWSLKAAAITVYMISRI